MKYSYSWLKELSGSKKTVEEIAELLTFHAFEIEGIEKNEKISDQVVVGEILEIQPHPNADKLQLTRVNVGKKELSIVITSYSIHYTKLYEIRLRSMAAVLRWFMLPM